MAASTNSMIDSFVRRPYFYLIALLAFVTLIIGSVGYFWAEAARKHMVTAEDCNSRGGKVKREERMVMAGEVPMMTYFNVCILSDGQRILVKSDGL